MSTVKLKIDLDDFIGDISDVALINELDSRGFRIVDEGSTDVDYVQELEIDVVFDVDYVLDKVDDDVLVEEIESRGWKCVSGDIDEEVVDDINQHGINVDDWLRLTELLLQKVKASNVWTVEEKLMLF